MKRSKNEKKKFNIHDKKIRIAVGIAFPLLCILGLLFLYITKGKYGPHCSFYIVSKWFYEPGIYCAGCGMGRALTALIHGDILLSFRQNPFLLIAGPFLVYYILKIYIAYVFGKDILPFWEINIPVGITIVSVLLVYTVLRNLPFPPFSTYLAPLPI